MFAPLLYRLIDESPESTIEKHPGQSIELTILYECLRHDLEQLLNSRHTGIRWHSEYRELAHSLLNYGIADFTHHHFANREAQQALCQHIQTVITQFEPRLQHVKVHLIDHDTTIDRDLQIHIDAQLNSAPTPVNASFESTLNIVQQDFHFI